MASFKQYTASGGASEAFSIKTFTSDEIKVYVAGVLKTTPTHYNITSYTVNGGTVTWTSGNVPSSGTIVRIVRDTKLLNNAGDAVQGKATYVAGASVKAGDLNDNQTQVLRALEEQDDQLIQSYDLEDGILTADKIAADAIDGSKIADNAINSEHYVDASIDTAHLSDSAVTSAKIADGTIVAGDLASNSVTTVKIADSNVTTAKINDGAVTGAKIANDAITESKIADEAIKAEHYTDGSVGTVHIADNAITSAKIAGGAVSTSDIADVAVTTAKIADSNVTTTKLATNAVTTVKITDGTITTAKLASGLITTDKLGNDSVTNAKIADNSIDSEHYVDGSIDTAHLANSAVTTAKINNDAITGAKIGDDQINSEHYAAGSIDTEHIADSNITTAKIEDNAVTADKIADSVIVTASEQAAHSVNDASFFTTSAAEARFFNASTGETIKDGQSFPDNDTTIATTAAINDRIIDLVDDVGGFVPIANETSFPNANPDVNNGTGTLVSVKTLASNLTSNGSGVATIANGTVGNSTVTINGLEASTTYSAGYGMIVETTSTLNTYSFHRLVPKATEVTTVAGKATEIGRLGTAAAVEDMGILGTADCVADMAILGTADVVSDLNTLATADIVSDMNTLATSANVTAMDNCSDDISNINTVSGSIANVNTVASNMGTVNDFAVRYRVGSSNPTDSLDTGDLFFNTSANELKVYNGSAWQGGVTATGSFAVVTGNTFTGENKYNDSVKAKFGSDSDLQIYHDGSNAFIDNTTGYFRLKNTGGYTYIDATTLRIRNSAGDENQASFIQNGTTELYYDNAKKFETTSTGIKLSSGASGVDDILHLDSTGNSQGHGAKISFSRAGSLRAEIQAVKVETANNETDIVFRTTKAGSLFDGLKIVGDTKNVQIPNDTGKLQIGASQDLQIYHDGSSSLLTNSTGYLLIRSDDLALTSSTGPENYLVANVNDGVDLYFDSSKKLETTSTGASITGSLYCSNGLDIDGEVNLSGTPSNKNFDAFITDGSTDYWMQFRAVRGGDSEHTIQMRYQNDGAVELNYDGAKKLETQSGGVQVDGQLVTYRSGGNAHIVAERASGARGHIQAQAAKLVFGTTTNHELNFITNGGTRATITTGGDIQLPVDSQKLQLGASQDLEIYHNGSHSYIDEVGTGGIKIRTAGEADVGFYKYATNEKLAEFQPDNSCRLYYDNVKKFETRSSGAQVTGQLEADEIYLRDDEKILLGTLSDLQIYHDGTSSWVDSGAHRLNIDSNDLRLRDSGGESYIHCINDAAVELYYNNGKRAETTNYGWKVNGNSNNPTTDAWETNSSIITSGAYGGGFAMIDGSAGFVQYTDTNGAQWHLRSAATDAAPEKNITAIHDGGIELYYDNSKKLETNSSGIHIFGNTGHADGAADLYGSGNDLTIYHDATNSLIKNDTGTLVLRTDLFALTNNADTESLIRGTANGAVDLYYDNSKKLETFANGIKLYDTDGTQIGEGFDGGFNFTSLVYVDELRLGDSEKIQLGASQDLQIYHSGTASFIKDTGTGTLYIDTNGDSINLISDSSNTYGKMGIFKKDGAVELYHDNVKKFETTTNGASITGKLALSDNLDMPDSARVILGTGDDLQLYHDGSNNFVDSRKGDLHLRAEDHVLIETQAGDGSGVETMASFVENAQVKLYYDNAVKLETHADGVLIGTAHDDINDTGVELRTNGQSQFTANGSQVAGFNRNTNNGTLINLYRSGTSRGSISITTSSTTYNTSSDYRLKENEVAISDGITRLKTLKPYRFNWKNEPSVTVDGFFAHEVSPAVPEAVTGEKDAPVNDRGDGYQQMDHSKLVPLLTAALKEAISKIETLETKVAALESS